MKIIDTSKLESDKHNWLYEGKVLTPSEVYWLYNGLDCCLTSEIRTKLLSQLDDTTRATYQHTMNMQAPILEMNCRGILTDRSHMKQIAAEYQKIVDRLEHILHRFCVEGIGMDAPFNPNSPTQVKHFFYSTLGIKAIRKKNSAGKMADSSDRETLEKLRKYFNAEPFVNLILEIRDYKKKIGFLNTPMPNNRLYTNFNLAGTNTGRLASRSNSFGVGTNLQNVDKAMKYMLVPDEGKVLVNVDLEQADSRNVGALAWNMFYDADAEYIAKYLGLDKWDGPVGPEFAGSYLDACESGDLHTTVCRMAWKDLDWPEDREGWRAIADQIAYRGLSYRDMSKKLGHGTNYLGQPRTMAMHTKVAVDIITEFQNRYSKPSGAFPVITAWQNKTIELLQTQGHLTHLFGRRRCFFGRLDDQSVINAAIAYCPQGMTGDAINIGILNLWHDKDFELLIQVHDSILFQIDQNRIAELVPRALELLEAPITLKGGRRYSIPLDAQVGWNAGERKVDKKTGAVTNPMGLVGWKGQELRSPPSRKRNLVSARSMF